MPQGPSLPNIRAVLFDVDGTLVDSLEMFVLGLGDTYEKFLGVRPGRERILALCGVPLSKQLRMFQVQEPSETRVAEMTAYALERYRAHQGRESVFPAAVETLRFVHGSGRKTALVTSKNAEELQGFLNRFSGAPFVDTTVCASDVRHPKPAPESAILACRKLGVEPHEAVFIGDSIYDLRCARSADVASVAVSYGAAQRELLASEMPDHLVDTPEELLAWAQTAFLEPSCPERGS
jgi:HAD superfamily hydrolase (TIGR01509 family)